LIYRGASGPPKTEKVMYVFIHRRGQFKGKINMAKTIESMKVGDVWETSIDDVRLESVRNLCTRYARISEEEFTVSSPKSFGKKIIVTRTK